MQQKRDESDSMAMATSKHPNRRKSSGELPASSDREKQHSLSRRSTTEVSAPAASRQSQDSTSKPESERWTREEYQSLINRALQEYTAGVASTTDTETKDLQQHGLRGGDESDVGAERATAVDTDQLDRKPAARPRERVEPRPIVTPLENDVLFGRSKHQKITQGINTSVSCVMKKGEFMIWLTATTRQKYQGVWSRQLHPLADVFLNSIRYKRCGWK